MIEESTRHRLAGDWRAACVAANIEVDFDRVPAHVEADLVHLAPDLLRWHLPRALGGRTSLASYQTWVLSSRTEPLEPGAQVLQVHTPKTVEGSQRLRLTIAEPGSQADFRDLAPWFWSAAHVGELRNAYGGSPLRLPGFTPDGSALPAESYPDRPDPADPVTREEAAQRLLAAKKLVHAWAAAGIPLDPTLSDDGPSYARFEMTTFLSQPLHLTAIAAEARRLAHRYGIESMTVIPGWRCPVLVTVTDGRPAARLLDNLREHYGTLQIGSATWRRPVDLDLVRHGLISPAELHPLVRAALAPLEGPPTAKVVEPQRIRVRCRGEWHEVSHQDGMLLTPGHTGEELRREEALHSLGGEVAGCAAARLAWTTGKGRLPKRLWAQRRDIVQRLLHGDSRLLLELLDQGLDPHLRDGRGRCLLHHLRLFDHTEVLPRLLAAGLPINATDHRGRTPLHVAIGDVGTPQLVLALLEAGAAPHIADAEDTTPLSLAKYKSVGYGEDDDEDYVSPQMRAIYQHLKDWTS